MNFWVHAILLGAAAGVGMSLGAAVQARVRPVEAGPQYLKDMQSIGDVIQGAGSEVHIFYIHGMRADRSGASKSLIETLRNSKLLPRATVGTSKYEPLPLGDRPAATYAGQPVWACLGGDQQCNLRGREDLAWNRSQPFTLTTTIEGAGRKVIVTEVNWWPLLMALKCRFLAVPDSLLSGPHKDQLRLCSKDQQGSFGPDGKFNDPYFDWLSGAEAERIIKRGAVAGSAAKGNGWVKRNIFNWGLADAVISLGPMRQYIRAAIDNAAAKAPKSGTQIMVTESLGSFVVMDASREPNIRSMIGQTRHFYFLANQFALLELGRIEGLKDGAGPAASPVDDASGSALRSFQEAVRLSNIRGVRPAQVVAVSDPSDMLSWHMPGICDIDVINLYWRFSGGPLNLLANPLKAHQGGVASKRLWKLLLKRTGNSAQGPKLPCRDGGTKVGA